MPQTNSIKTNQSFEGEDMNDAVDAAWLISVLSIEKEYGKSLAKGGRGSGNFGHAGRPGNVGGSSAGGSGGVIRRGMVIGGESSARDSFLNSMSQEWQNSLTDAEKEAVAIYTGGDYYRMNTILRNDSLDGADATIKGQIMSLQSALEKAPPFPADVQVTRSFKYAGMAEAVRDGRIKVGQTITDEGFVSTTSMARVKIASNSDSIWMDIFVPKGTTNAVWLNGLSEYSDESEVLFGAGMNMKLVGAEYDATGAVFLSLEVIP